MFLRRKKSKKDLLKEQMSELTGKAVEMSGRAATTLAPAVESARETAREAAGAAYEAATPHVSKAKAAAVPAVAAAWVKAASVLPSHEEPEPPKKKGGRLKRLLLLLGLGGVAYAVSQQLKASSTPTTPSRPTSVPNPAPNPGATPTPVPPRDIEKPTEAETTKPLVDTGDAHPAGGDDGHSTGR